MARKPPKAPENSPATEFVPVNEFGVRLDAAEAIRLLTSSLPVYVARTGEFINGRRVPEIRSDRFADCLGQLARCCGRNLRDSDATALRQSIEAYRLARAKEIWGSNERDVQKEIQRIQDTTGELKALLDNLSPARAAAWARIDQARIPHDRLSGGSISEELYPSLSLLIARVSRLAETYAENSLHVLVSGLASIWTKAGLRASASNGIVDRAGEDGESQFTQFVRSALAAVPLDPPFEGDVTASALNKAVSRSLARIRGQ